MPGCKRRSDGTEEDWVKLSLTLKRGAINRCTSGAFDNGTMWRSTDIQEAL
jgi:hypothetical protein